MIQTRKSRFLAIIVIVCLAVLLVSSQLLNNAADDESLTGMSTYDTSESGILEIQEAGVLLHIEGAAETPDVHFDGKIVTIESVDIDKAEIKIPHDRAPGIKVLPKLMVKEDGDSDFSIAEPYCKEDGDCFNQISIGENYYLFNVEHFSSYYVQDDIWTVYDSFNDSITDGNLVYYNHSELQNKWRNRTKYFEDLYSWTNVSYAEFDVNDLTSGTNKMFVGDMYSNGNNRGFRGMAYNGTNWYTDDGAGSDSIVLVWDQDWNLIDNITVQVPGGGMSCDYRDLELDPQDPSQLMVLCSESSAGFNWIQWANLTSGLQDWSRNWTLPNGHYKAAALTNNYIILSGDDGRLYRFNKTDGTHINNISAPFNLKFQGGWSNGTHAYFMAGHEWLQNQAFYVCDENLTACSNYGWQPPQCESSASWQEEYTSDFVMTDDFLAISWDERTDYDSCDNSVDLYYNKEFTLSADFEVRGWDGTLLADYSDLGDSIDFKDDLEDFIANGCSPNSDLECDPYTLTFKAKEGVVQLDNINLNLTTEFTTLKSCLDMYNGTHSCCVVDKDNYYEKLPSGAGYEIGDSSCAIRAAGDNLTLDLNHVPFIIVSGASQNGFYVNRDIDNLKLYNAIFDGYTNRNFMFDGYQHSNFVFENLTSIGTSSYFVFGTNLSIKNFNSIDCTSAGSCLDISRGDYYIENVNMVNSDSGSSSVFFDQISDSTFRNFTINEVQGNCIQIQSLRDYVLFDGFDCQLNGAIGLNSIFGAGTGNVFKDFKIDGAETGVFTDLINVSYINMRIESNEKVGFEVDPSSLYLLIRDIKIDGASQEGMILGGSDHTVDNVTILNTGNSTINTGYESTFSPLRYNGTDFDDGVLYADATLLIINGITEDGDLVDVADGTNNFHLCLANFSNLNYTIYYDAAAPVDCAAIAAGNSGEMHYEALNYWISNGAGNNYTLNQTVNVTVVAGNTSPAKLWYHTDYVQTNPPISVIGSNITLSNITFGDSLNPIYHSIVFKSTPEDLWDIEATDNTILNSNFIYAGPLSLNGLNNFCKDNIGNFYEESLTPPSTDCGPSSFTSIYEYGYNPVGTVQLQWTEQSAHSYVTYEIIVYNESNGETTVLSADESDRDYTINLSDYSGGDYNIRVIPWVNGSRINGTSLPTIIVSDDVDGDGFGYATDCDDTDASVIPLINNQTNYINRSVTLCDETYYSNNGTDFVGFVEADADNIIITCDNTRIISESGANTGFAGFMILDHTNVTIQGCTAENYGYDFLVLNGDNNTFQNNIARNPNIDGINWIPPQAGFADVNGYNGPTGTTTRMRTGNRFINNIVTDTNDHNNSVGIAILSGDEIIAYDQISGNTISGIGIGIGLIAAYPFAYSSMVNNDIDVDMVGIMLTGWDEDSTVIYNTISGNTIRSQGEIFTDSSTILVNGSGIGIYLNSSYNNITNNILNNPRTVRDIYVYNESSINNQIWDNDFRGKGVGDSWENNTYCVDDVGNTYREWGTMAWDDCGRVITQAQASEDDYHVVRPAYYESSIIEVTETPQTVEVSTAQPIEFRIDGEMHQLILNKVYVDRADVTIKSTPVDLTFEVVVEKELDLDGDGHNEFYIKLNEITGNKAVFVLKKLVRVSLTEKPDEKEENDQVPITKPIFDETEPKEKPITKEGPSMLSKYENSIYVLSFMFFAMILIVALVLAYRRHYLTYVVSPIEKAGKGIEKRAVSTIKKVKQSAKLEVKPQVKTQVKSAEVLEVKKEIKPKKIVESPIMKKPQTEVEKPKPSSGILSRFTSKSQPQSQHPIHKKLDEIESHVKKLSGEDLTDKQIENRLKKAGWKDEHIDLVLSEAHQPDNQIYKVYQYAQKQGQKGKSKKEIREVLDTVGWPDHIIDLVLEFDD